MAINIPSCIGQNFDQICFVVRDLDEAITFWRDVNGISKWSKVYDLAKNYDPETRRGHVDKKYWGEAEDFQFNCAYAFVGTTLVELAEHAGGRTVYKDWLAERGESMHHIGFRLPTLDEYEATVKHYHDSGLVIGMEGKFKADEGYCLWTYFDTRKTIGCFTEIYYLHGFALTMYEDFRDGRSEEFMPGAPGSPTTPKAA